jgi:asparagine synthetase B (glutamine-hydrolysing)
MNPIDDGRTDDAGLEQSPLVLRSRAMMAPSRAVWDRSRTCWAIVTGRIVNRAELWQKTRDEQGAEPSSDAALVARGYREFGEGFLHGLAGAFACVVGDDSSRTVTAIVDPLGAQPLYFAEATSILALCSDTRALRSLPWVDDTPDHRRVVAYLHDCDYPADATFYRGIRRIPAGHLLRWRGGESRVVRYWGPRFERPDGIRTQRDFIERFRELVLASTRETLNHRQHSAILLSGGFDSTTVAAAAKLVSPASSRVRTYSAVFGTMACDESDRVRAMLGHLPFPSRRLDPRGVGITIEQAHRDIGWHDAPYINLQRPIFDAYPRAAREDGIDTLITGLGGDELTVDYDYQVDLRRERGRLAAVLGISRLEQTPVMTVVSHLLRSGMMARIAGTAGWARPLRNLRDTRRNLLTPDARRTLAWLEQGTAQEAATQDEAEFDAWTKTRRWRTLTQSREQEACAWWTTELRVRGLALESPLQHRALFELVLGADIGMQPRSVDTGLYKPTMVLAFSEDIPRELTRRYWKPTFDEYVGHVISLSQRSLIGAISSFADWKAGRYVNKETVLEAIERGPFWRRTWAVRAIGLELWLQARAGGSLNTSGIEHELPDRGTTTGP